MESRVKFAIKNITRQIEWAEQELQEDRKQVMKVAEYSDADQIIAWAQNMKRTENRIKDLKQQLSVVAFIADVKVEKEK